jgi:hypothetical protein
MEMGGIRSFRDSETAKMAAQMGERLSDSDLGSSFYSLTTPRRSWREWDSASVELLCGLLWDGLK